MDKKQVTLIIIAIVIVLVGSIIMFYNLSIMKREVDFETKICNLTLELIDKRPSAINIDKDKVGAFTYVSIPTISVLSAEFGKGMQISPEERKNFNENTRIKLRIDDDKSIVCDGIIDIGEKPRIKLLGSKEITIPKGSKFEEPGYTAFDYEDTDISHKVIKNGVVNTEVKGTYTLLYFVEDNMGNVVSTTRRVIVE